MELTERRELRLLPPLPPPLLQEAIEQYVTSKPGFSDPAHGFWQEKWHWWNDFANKISEIPNIRGWLGQNVAPVSDDRAREACVWWVDRLMPQRPSPLVLYAQRQQLAEWFSEYDPASTDQLEDTDRPWDMDHIHPSNYVNGKRYIPQIIKGWHGCIGNLRAWPLEANRARHDKSPAKKLSEPDEKEKSLGLCDGQQIRQASFIEENREWQLWHASTPKKEGFSDKYLANQQDPDGRCRPVLIKAITSRWIRLYEEWYDTLLVASLFVDQGTSCQHAAP